MTMRRILTITLLWGKANLAAYEEGETRGGSKSAKQKREVRKAWARHGHGAVHGVVHLHLPHATCTHGTRAFDVARAQTSRLPSGVAPFRTLLRNTPLSCYPPYQASPPLPGYPLTRLPPLYQATPPYQERAAKRRTGRFQMD